MVMSLTKNKLSEQCLKDMIQQAFPSKALADLIELKEGYFNVAYLVKFLDKEEAILKIAPSPDSDVMSYEKNIMFSEVDSMKRVLQETELPLANVLFYDDTHTLCNADYFFMEKLEGVSFSSCIDELSDLEKADINLKVGKLNCRLNQIVGDQFGYYGQYDTQGDDWFLVFNNMITMAFDDALRKQIDLKIDQKELFNLLKQDHEIFKEVTQPKLVHWDLWAGNVFVLNGQVSGLIDFERCLWADELMEFGFRTYQLDANFLKGYGIESLTDNQTIRAQWYDIYLLLVMSLECDYRQYESRDIYNWAIQGLGESITKIKERLQA